MRHLLLVILVTGMCSTLSAATLEDMSLSEAMNSTREQHSPSLFEPREISFDLKGDRLSGLERAQVLEDGDRESADQMFGAGGALGLNLAAIGLGVGGWFDFYFMPYVAISSYATVAYGINGDPYHNGGDALLFSLSIGAKFVLDFEDIEITEWFRPFMAFYPLGFAYYASTEDADEQGSGNTRDVKYNDLYFLMAGGIGADFYLTHMIGIGFGFYIYGTLGGSKHKHSAGIETRTNGNVSAYIEYARISLRF